MPKHRAEKFPPPQAARQSSARYDALIVDKAQDFDPRWWQPLHSLLRDRENGLWYLFYDDNQRLYDRPFQFPINDIPYQLTVNCRTTCHIHEQVLRFYLPGEETPPPVAHGPQGRPVEVLTYDERTETVQQAVIAILRNLIEGEHIPASAIAVLTPYAQRKSLLKADSLRPTKEIALRWSASAEGTNQVLLETIHRFKGLERPVVILAEIERRLAQERDSRESERLLYVACSRARHHLIVLLPKRADVQLARLFGA